ncbi:MAG: geranylgeranylglycerol-phosphate geranylgeranyltransferase [Candidatus Aenigmarchaeota archaeon]|nr:geranylgeranylglycerol-phosphate geranylgeranyltransferase [Candidatus Aenigmarchaeota archaeon]
MNPYITIMRPVNGSMAAVAVVLGALIAGVQDGAIVIAAISAFLISSAGMVANDIFDYRIDKVNKPKRPIPSGLISLRGASLYSGALFGLGVGLTALLNIYVFGLALFNALLEMFYANKLKRTPAVGNIAVSWLVGSTYVFGGLLSGSHDILHLAGPLLLGNVAFVANMARELYKTASDYKGDKRYGAITVAVVFGKERAKLAGDIFAVLAAASSLAPYFAHILGNVYISIQLISIAVYLSALFKSAEKAEKLTKIGMFIGLVAIAAELGSRLL